MIAYTIFLLVASITFANAWEENSCLEKDGFYNQTFSFNYDFSHPTNVDGFFFHYSYEFDGPPYNGTNAYEGDSPAKYTLYELTKGVAYKEEVRLNLTLSCLEKGWYCFAVSAYNMWGESGLSNEICVTVPAPSNGTVIFHEFDPLILIIGISISTVLTIIFVVVIVIVVVVLCLTGCCSGGIVISHPKVQKKIKEVAKELKTKKERKNKEKEEPASVV